MEFNSRSLKVIKFCVIAVPDPDLEMGGRGGTVSPNIFFSALRASVWSKNKGGRAPPLDPPLDSLVTADENARTV